MSTITATFKTRTAAEDALEQLEAAGIMHDQISLVVTDSTRGKNFNIDTHSKADEGAAGGATAGGIIGAALGAVAAAGVIVVPGLNLVVTGALAGSLAGLATGAVTGGLLGGLIGAGVTEHEAKLYEKEVRDGAILLAVQAKSSDQKTIIKDILKRTDAYNLAA